MSILWQLCVVLFFDGRLTVMEVKSKMSNHLFAAHKKLVVIISQMLLHSRFTARESESANEKLNEKW